MSTTLKEKLTVTTTRRKGHLTASQQNSGTLTTGLLVSCAEWMIGWCQNVCRYFLQIKEQFSLLSSISIFVFQPPGRRPPGTTKARQISLASYGCKSAAVQ
jgi:hypothetical protein